jgi:hypothetical protein
MKRRDRHLPPNTSDPAGIFIRRNPGVTAVWVTKYNKWHEREVANGLLFDIGEPDWVEWYAHGRSATRNEVMESFDSGMPALHEAAHADPELAREACERLDMAYSLALGLIPKT